MQPDMLRSSSPDVVQVIQVVEAALDRLAMGIDLALASEQKSPPGQQTMSVSSPMLGVARPRSLSSPQRPGSDDWRTSARIRFCSCETRSSPKL